MERMAADAQRVSIVMAARNRQTIGVRGMHDVRWKRAYKVERDAKEAGWATRHGEKGCVCCATHVPDAEVCTLCHGWVKRDSTRGSRMAHQRVAEYCASCGQPTHLVHHGRTERVKAPRNIRRQRELRPEAGPRWAGFAGLARTVTERLVQTPTNDVTPSDTQHWTKPLADVQHVLSGKCSASLHRNARQSQRHRLVSSGPASPVDEV